MLVINRNFGNTLKLLNRRISVLQIAHQEPGNVYKDY